MIHRFFTHLKNYGLWLAILVVCIGFQISGRSELWRYDRHLIEQGDLWLFFSSHFVHLGWNHFYMNMAMLVMVPLFFPRHRLLLFVITLLVSILSIGLGLYYLSSEIIWYVGLSGVLHGLFVMGALVELQRHRVYGGVLLLAISGKLIFEQYFGALPSTESFVGGSVIIDAHLYGAVAGLLVALLNGSFYKSVPME